MRVSTSYVLCRESCRAFSRVETKVEQGPICHGLRDEAVNTGRSGEKHLLRAGQLGAERLEVARPSNRQLLGQVRRAPTLHSERPWCQIDDLPASNAAKRRPQTQTMT